MDSDSKLEATIDKILAQSESEMLSGLKAAHAESEQTLSRSRAALEEEYDRILDEARKEAQKISKQLVGSSDLKARNKQLLLVQDSISDVFDRAVEEIGRTDRDADYAKLVSALIREAVTALGTQEVLIYTSAKDKESVQSVLGDFPGAAVSPDVIDCLGGVRVRSKDGSMSFDNTIDSRIERMKPLIRKEIATEFGIGN